MILITLLSSCSNSAPETHTVTFYSEEEVFLTEDVVHGQAVSRPEKTPSRPGSYRFISWQTEDGNDYNFSLPVTEDLSLYAGWQYYSTVTYYTVTFDGNEPEGMDASGLPDPITGIRAGEGIAEPDTEGMTLDGYSFDGWYKDKDCKEEFVFASETISSSITLYAKWTELFTVRFDTGEGGPDVISQEIKDGGIAIKPSTDPIRPEYQFGGWYGDSEFASEYDFASPVESDITIYAKWNPFVTFDANGEDVTGMPSPIAAEDGKVSEPEAEPSREGYTFKWWSTDEKGTKFNFDTPITTPTILYAVWEIKTFTVTFDVNGNSSAEAPDEQEVNWNESIEEPIFEKVAGNSVFEGWYEKKDNRDLADAVFDFNAPITDNITLYAKWTEYAGAYDLSSGAPSTMTTEQGKEYYLTGNGSTTVSITGNGTVILEDVSIEVTSGIGISVTSGSPAIQIQGKINKVSSGDDTGIAVSNGATVTIKGYSTADVLTAIGGNGGAGIGSPLGGTTAGNVSINNVTINATGSGESYQYICGAGIGSSGSGNCGDITITDAVVNANGGAYSPGIGMGYGNTSQPSIGKITITNSDVTAKAGYFAAAIGLPYTEGAAGATPDYKAGQIIITTDNLETFLSKLTTGGTANQMYAEYAQRIGKGSHDKNNPPSILDQNGTGPWEGVVINDTTYSDGVD